MVAGASEILAETSDLLNWMKPELDDNDSRDNYESHDIYKAEHQNTTIDSPLITSNDEDQEKTIH